MILFLNRNYIILNKETNIYKKALRIIYKYVTKDYSILNKINNNNYFTKDNRV